MAELRLKATAQTDEEIDDLIQRLQRMARPRSKDMRKVGDAVRLGFASNFTRQGSGAGRWPTLAESTQQERQREGYAARRPILVRTGSYRASWTQRNHPQHGEEFETTRKGFRLTVGSEDERVPWHEQGSVLGPLLFGRGRLPARPVAPLGRQDEERVMGTLEFVLDGIWLSRSG